MVEDIVNHPPHYKSAAGLESIEVIEAFQLGFRLGNVVKYVLRAEKKGNRLTDLQKAKWYLEREIAALEKAAMIEGMSQLIDEAAKGKLPYGDVTYRWRTLDFANLFAFAAPGIDYCWPD